MKRWLFPFGGCLGLWLACGGDARTTLHPPPDSAGGAAGSGTSAVAGTGGAAGSGAGGAAPVSLDAGVDASDASPVDDVDDGGLDPGGPIPVIIDPESIVFFSLPVDSVRFAAAGYDSAKSICAILIWDYSNNELEPGLHCDDFDTYPDFPYVVVQEQVQNCDGAQGDYAGLEPEVASGCFDPLTESVDVELEVFSIPTFYRIVMSNQ